MERQEGLWSRLFGKRGSAASPQGWVEVAVAPNQVVAGMLEGALKAEGIPVIVRRPHSFPYTGMAGMHGVMVPEDREEEARSLIEQVWPDGDEDEEEKG